MYYHCLTHTHTHTNRVSYGGPWALWSLHLKCRAVVDVWLWRNPRNRLYLSWTPMNHKEQEGRSEVTALRLTGKIHFMGTFWSHLWRRQWGLVGDEVYELLLILLVTLLGHWKHASRLSYLILAGDNVLLLSLIQPIVSSLSSCNEWIPISGLI